MRKKLSEYEEELHKCSQCGLCMAVCPLYLETRNDCFNPRGLFAMLNGVLRGELEFDESVKKYLEKCDKCGKCREFCPSGIDIPQILESAKEEE